jgi:hypothetical protein
MLDLPPGRRLPVHCPPCSCLCSLGLLVALVAPEVSTGEWPLSEVDSIYSCSYWFRIKGLGCFKNPRTIWIWYSGQVFFLWLLPEPCVHEHSFAVMLAVWKMELGYDHSTSVALTPRKLRTGSGTLLWEKNGWNMTSTLFLPCTSHKIDVLGRWTHTENTSCSRVLEGPVFGFQYFQPEGG